MTGAAAAKFGLPWGQRTNLRVKTARLVILALLLVAAAYIAGALTARTLCRLGYATFCPASQPEIHRDPSEDEDPAPDGMLQDVLLIHFRNEATAGVRWHI
jgi:hypothetical protein